jgi:hypothetical protein
MNAQQTQDIQGAVRIGNGQKLHPAIKDAHYGLIIRCRCPGTQQGGARNNARFIAGATGNCKN